MLLNNANEIDFDSVINSEVFVRCKNGGGRFVSVLRQAMRAVSIKTGDKKVFVPFDSVFLFKNEKGQLYKSAIGEILKKSQDWDKMFIKNAVGAFVLVEVKDEGETVIPWISDKEPFFHCGFLVNVF